MPSGSVSVHAKPFFSKLSSWKLHRSTVYLIVCVSVFSFPCHLSDEQEFAISLSSSHEQCLLMNSVPRVALLHGVRCPAVFPGVEDDGPQSQLREPPEDESWQVVNIVLASCVNLALKNTETVKLKVSCRFVFFVCILSRRLESGIPCPGVHWSSRWGLFSGTCSRLSILWRLSQVESRQQRALLTLQCLHNKSKSKVVFRKA